MSYLLSITLFLNLFSFSSSDPRISEASLICGKKYPPKNTNYIPIFVKEMESLSSLVNSHNYGHHHLSNSTPPIFALAQCFHDLTNTECQLCYAAARTRVPRCLPSAAARIFLDGCFLRYDNYDFFNETVDGNNDRVLCGGGVATGETESFKELVRNLSDVAVRNKGFAAMEVKGVFGLAQCWKSLSREGCGKCLERAGDEVVKKCVPNMEGRGLNAGCYLRYSTHQFYNDKNGNSNKSSGSLGVIVAIALAATAILMLFFFAAYASYRRFKKSKEERKNLGQISYSFNKSSLSFKYETLEKATNYFNISRKLGQGGAGSVFRGTLSNGKDVAVKRLFFNTRQWVDEFFNEVNLISGIQHKNLVKLLGCSIEGPESLLVYEYVHNKSLDQFLFDKNKSKILNWKQRFEIIVGTAEGLAHLHGGCEIRIIHRDIKCSNVLLDENLAPKIADFGLARCFGEDKTHLTTGIAGTLGYMAPEYLVRGQLTEKADVYSFGVLVLEIVCGKKNNTLIEDASSLLQMVWNLYKIGKLSESVDHCLKDDFPIEEASNVLQIGLLCTQASAALRPSMPEIIKMLINSDYDIPIPNQPPFLNAKVPDPALYKRTYGIDNLIPNALTKIEVSYTTTEESSSMQSSDGQSRN